MRHGSLAFERYFPGEDALWGRPLGRVDFDAQTLHDLRSVTKSVLAILVGIAQREGALPDLDARIAELLPHPVARREALSDLRLRQVLTMSAGLAWDELSHPYSDPRNDEHAMMLADDPVAYALGRPVIAAPGERFAYNGGLPNVLGEIVEQATGTPLMDYAAERLFCPLGVSRAEWVRHASGSFVSASGLRLRPRDMARLGQLVLDDGRAGGVELASRAYLRAATSAQIGTGGGLAPAYGFQWWIDTANASANGAPVALAIGNGGQRIAVIRPLDLVVVVTAGAYDSPDQGRVPAQIVRDVLRAAGRDGERPDGGGRPAD